MVAVESMFLLQYRGAGEVDGEVWRFRPMSGPSCCRRQLM